MTDIIKQIVIDELYSGKTAEEIADDLSDLFNQGIEEYKELTKTNPAQEREDYLGEIAEYLIDAIHEEDIGTGWVAAAWTYYWGVTQPEFSKDDLEEIEEITQKALENAEEDFSKIEEQIEEFSKQLEQPKKFVVKTDNDEEIVRKFLETILR